MHALRPTLSIRLAMLTALIASGASALSGCGTAAPTSDDDASDVASFHDEGLLGNGLTRAEVRTVLKLIDDTCGDTWCEGDYAFRFRHLFCDTQAGTCTLALQMALRGDAPSPFDWRWRTCRTPGFTGFDSLVNGTSGGYQWLATSYYESLDACIGALEGPTAER